MCCSFHQSTSADARFAPTWYYELASRLLHPQRFCSGCLMFRNTHPAHAAATIACWDRSNKSQPLACAGATARMRSKFGNKDGDQKGTGMKKSASQLAIDKERVEKDHSLVKDVMETSGGDNAALARKIHDRYDKCAALSIPDVSGTCPLTPQHVCAFAHYAVMREESPKVRTWFSAVVFATGPAALHARGCDCLRVVRTPAPNMLPMPAALANCGACSWPHCTAASMSKCLSMLGTPAPNSLCMPLCGSCDGMRPAAAGPA